MTDAEKRFKFLEQAFMKDGFQVKDLSLETEFKDLSYIRPGGYLELDGKIGVLAEHTRVFNTDTGEPKRTYYVEGNYYQMGFLLGMMAQPQVQQMLGPFTDNIIQSFFHVDGLSHIDGASILDKIKGLLIDLLGKTVEKVDKDLPEKYKQEMEGIYQGCNAVNPELDSSERKKEFMEKMWSINFGLDYLLAHIYTGDFFIKENIPPYLLRVPVACNAISIKGGAVEGGKHYFGRDFMFPTAGVYQDTACMIIYNPDKEEGKTVLPIVSQTAPGLIGSMAALNLEGVAIGVDMSPSKLCNPERPGINSLCLNRDTMTHCATAEDAVNHIIDAPRGVSWLYPVADGKSGKACIVEAGCNTGDNPFPYLDFLPDHFKDNLDLLTVNYIEEKRKKYRTPAPQKGAIPRWADYNYPADYITDFNQKIWHLFNTDFRIKFEEFAGSFLPALISSILHPQTHHLLKELLKDALAFFKKKPYVHQRFGTRGFIDPSWQNTICPGPFYFAPQRENLDDVVIASNHFITPEMRLTTMDKWISFIIAGNLNDLQWRYDEMNNQVLEAVTKAKDPGNPELIDADKAWRLINFLSPEPGYDFPNYRNPDGTSWKTRTVHGSISLFNLTDRWMRSSFGYYGDGTVQITLPNYFE